MHAVLHRERLLAMIAEWDLSLPNVDFLLSYRNVLFFYITFYT